MCVVLRHSWGDLLQQQTVHSQAHILAPDQVPCSFGPGALQPRSVSSHQHPPGRTTKEGTERSLPFLPASSRVRSFPRGEPHSSAPVPPGTAVSAGRPGLRHTPHHPGRLPPASERGTWEDGEQ